MGSDLLFPGLLWASQTGEFDRIFVTVPNRPLFPGLISASETGAFGRILVIAPNGQLPLGLLCVSQAGAIGRIFAIVSNRLLFPRESGLLTVIHLLALFVNMAGDLLLPIACGTNLGFSNCCICQHFCDRAQPSLVSGTYLRF